MPPRSTGLASADAQDDFLRARRAAARARLRRRFGREDAILPFEEVVAALGRLGEQDLGVRSVDLDSIVGTVDRGRGFDRSFRPLSGTARVRWERIAALMRRGEPMPPIDVYRIGDVHFVRDGHHRVSVARALGVPALDAHVVEVRTRIGADRALTLADLPLKSHERAFRERVPVPPEAAARVVLSDPERYGELAEGIEAWGYRAGLERGQVLGRGELARAWFEEEFVPVVAMIREAGLAEGGTDADAYLDVGALRWRLLHTHEWSPEVLAGLHGRR